MKCENKGLFGGDTAEKECTGKADYYITIDENEFHLKPMYMCEKCERHLRDLMELRCQLHGGTVKVTYSRV